MVKVNRVEGDCLGLSIKEPSYNSESSPFPSHSSSVKNDLKAETIIHTDPQHLSRSGTMTRTPEGLRQWPETSQVDQSTNESRCLLPEPQDVLTSQDCSIRAPPLEDNKPSSTYHATSSCVETQMGLCATYSETPTSGYSCREDTLSVTPNTDSKCAGTETHNNTKTETMDTVINSKHISPHTTTEALYDLKTEPVEGGISTSCCTFPSSVHRSSLERKATEENLFPPLLQRSALDMPQLTPEPADKVGICPLPPVLTQEMPSLTPADDRLPEAAKSTSCSDQVAPVLQRETSAGCLPSHGAKQEVRDFQLMMSNEPLTVEHANKWHLDFQYNCEGAAVSGLERHGAHLTANAMHKITSGGVYEMQIMPDIAAGKDHANLENLTCGRSDASPGQLVHSSALETGQQSNVIEVTNTHYPKESAQGDHAFTLSSAGSLITGTSNNHPQAPPPSLSTQSESLSELQLHHHTTHSSLHCASQNPYVEAKPFSSSIWKNLNSHSPAVLIQSLHPELPSAFTHDPLPYTMWTEPQCKEVTDLEDTEQDLRQSENQEEGGPLTWAQLQPTSLISVGAGERMGLCGDYEVQRGKLDGAEALSFCRELGRRRELEESLHSDNAVSPLRMGGGEQDGVFDMEEGGSDGEEAEQQSSAKGESSSDSSDEEENDTSNSECDESGLEPGEVCAVSVLLHTGIHIQSLTQV